MSAWKKLTMASGKCILVLSNWAAWMNKTFVSKTPGDEKDEEKCYLCPRTNLLPMSPAAHGLPANRHCHHKPDQPTSAIDSW
jgi:hypothetical protein